MKRIAIERGEFLLIVRLGNAAAIERVYGSAARKAALRQIERGAKLLLSFLRTSSVGYDEVALLVPAGLLTPGLIRRVVDSLCLRLSMKPMEFADANILLAVDAGYSNPAERLMRRGGRELEAQAREQLASSIMPALLPCPQSPEEVHQYRVDVANAASLLEAIEHGQGLFAWRPVYHSQAPDRILHYEAILRLIGKDGKQADCREGSEALERLGLSYLRDRQLVCHVMDELEADQNACLAIRISPSSLSFDLNGQGSAWSDMMLRLRNIPGLADRLTLELMEPTPERMLPAAKGFVEKLKAMGVKIAIAGFASDFSSIRQMLAFQPDAIKLPGAFLRSMSRIARNDIGLRHLIGLASTFSDIVIVDGVENFDDLREARKEGAEWLVGEVLGHSPRTGQPDLCSAYVPYARDSEILHFIYCTAGYHFPLHEEVVQDPFLDNTLG